MNWIGIKNNSTENNRSILFNLNMIKSIEMKENTVWFDTEKVILKTQEDATQFFNDLKKLLQIS